MSRLGALLAAAGLPAPTERADLEVTAVVEDSRRACPGAVFVAISGMHHDGHAHAAEAAAAGAVAVVAERPCDPPLAATLPVILVSNSRVALSGLAAALYDQPSEQLTVAGVTGTDGKTTTATMLWAAWRAAGIRAASLTTVDFRNADHTEPNTSRLTTLGAVETQRRLAQIRESRSTHVALETSSHALAQHRVDDVRYGAAVYTKITSEHLDLHGDRQAYLRAKARLLNLVGDRADGLAVLDRDDDFAFSPLVAMRVAHRLTYSASGDPAADLIARDVCADAAGVTLSAHTPWGDAPMKLQLAGRFNAANALAAIAGACATGASLSHAVLGLESLSRVHGRMERVDRGQPFALVIDYAHTADALEKVLAELRIATRGQLWVVFGSAGERDRSKRPAMGEVAARCADRIVVTDEDPRREDRVAICEEIAAGATQGGAQRGSTLQVIPDRSEAIRFAVSHAGEGDTVLLAGKGHETSIISGEANLPWNERSAAEAALAERGFS